MSVRWTEEQAAAITCLDHTLLSASAGTGKTTTIVGKILWSLGIDYGKSRTGPLPPCPAALRLDQIAAITFTEKAAHDLADKLRTAIEGAPGGAQLRWELERATVGTIHAFAADLLREHALRIGIDPAFRILDPRETEIQQSEIVREVLAGALRERDAGAGALARRYGLVGWKMSPGAVDRVVGAMRDLRWRARQNDAWSTEVEATWFTRRLDREALRQRARFAGAWSDDEADAQLDEASLELADALYRLGRTSVGAWLSWLERENARDFDSLILDARRLLVKDAGQARSAVREKYRLFIIDEFQDTDRSQWEMACAIAGLPQPSPPADLSVGEPPPGAPSEPPSERDAGPAPQLVLVGDPKQSIYRFRGADIDVWNEARRLLEAHGRTLHLSANFRCEPELVEVVNRVAARALDETAAPLAASAPESVIRHEPLRGARSPSPAARVEWLAVDVSGNAMQCREAEANRLAAHIRGLVGEAAVLDPVDGTLRPCRLGDIAVLARRNEDLSLLEPALRASAIRFYNTATRGLTDQQEVLDLITALRLIDNRFDDLRAFAFLRSPFVGLRDEVLVRIGMFEGASKGRSTAGGKGLRSLLERAAAYLRAVESGREAWFEAPETPLVGETERAALSDGLAAIAEAHDLVDRIDHAEILERLLDRTGYRLHLLLREGAAESMANIERLLALLQEYRHLSLSRFLALWAAWGEKDLGLPQAKLYASGDDVVTLSTVHAAKGLEWPVVILAGAASPLVGAARLVNEHWTDPLLGPVLVPRADARGPRAALALQRRLEQERAEEARLLYVAATRARDRLVVVGPTEALGESFAGWLSGELERAVEAHRVRADDVDDERAPNGSRRSGRTARDPDQATGTGGQLDAFGGAGARSGQFDLFAPAGSGRTPPSGGPGLVVVRGGDGAVQTSLPPPPVTLAWLAQIEAAPPLPDAEDIEPPAVRLVSSATERMVRASSEREWELRYRYGVVPPKDFLPDPLRDGPLPGAARGALIHGVLERFEAEAELGRVLDEAIASLDLGDLEAALAPGSTYREALEREIARVVRSPAWSWYVEGAHHRELRFLHRSRHGWVAGAFDLYRPGEQVGLVPDQVSLFEGPTEAAAAGRAAWVIDFKTHRIEADQAARIAADYAPQIDTYREAALALARPAQEGGLRVALHFTHPNVSLEV